MRYMILGAALILAGCAAKRTPPPAIEVRVERVDVPIPVPCVDRSDIPASPAHVGDKLNRDAGHDSNILAAANLRLRNAFDKAVALLMACVR